MRGAKVVGEILSGLGLVLFIIGIWTGKPRTKPGLWLSCLLALWLAVTVPGPGFEPVIDAGLPVPVWCALTSLAILVFREPSGAFSRHRHRSGAWSAEC